MRAGDARLAFVVGTELANRVRSAAKHLPIVFVTPGDPVRAGLAASWHRPGNNLTGMTFEFPEVLPAKRVELLKEIVPAARRVGVVYDNRDSSPRRDSPRPRSLRRSIGFELVEIDVETLGTGASAAVRTDPLDGLLLIPAARSPP